MVPGLRLTHIRLLVDDFDSVFRFYRDSLRLKPTWGDEGGSYASFETGRATLSLFVREGQRKAVDLNDGAPSDSAVLVLETDGDLDQLVDDVVESGAALIAAPADQPNWGIRTAHLRDPAGNLIELAAPLPESQWSQELRADAAKYKSGPA